MLIESLHLRHFRSHVDTVIDGLGPVNVFLGPLEAGKSSLVDALCFAFTGTCRGTDEGGKGASDLVTVGSDANTFGIRARFRAVVGGAYSEHSIVRGGGEGPRHAAQRGIDTTFGWRYEVMRTLFRPDSFLSLPAGEQAAIVASLSAPASIREVVRRAVTVDGRQLLEDADLPDTAAQLDGLESRCKEGRKKVKDAIAEKAAAESLLKNLSNDLRSAPLAALREQKTENDSQRKRLEMELDHLNKKKAAKAAPAGGGHHLAELDAEIAALRAGAKVDCPHCLKRGVFIAADEDGDARLMTVDGVAEALRVLEATRSKAAQPKLPAPTSEVDHDLPRKQVLTQTIASLTALSAEIDRAILLRESAETEAKALEVLRTRLNTAERVCKLLAPKGEVRAAVMEAGNTGGGFDFVGAVNRVMAWGGWGQVEVRSSPWAILRNGIRADLLSTSARWRLNFAIQAAIAEASGVRVVVLDGADVLTRGHSGSLIEAAVNAVRDGLIDQVFILASRDLGEIPARAPEQAFKVYVVDQQQGRSSVLDLAEMAPADVTA